MADVLAVLDDDLGTLAPHLGERVALADLLLFQLAAQVWCDPQFGGVPEAIHLPDEVFGELGRVNGEQGFIVGVGSHGDGVLVDLFYP